MRSLCVYCGSSPGADAAYTTAAASLGSLLARQDIRVVYGGGRVGLMGVLADAAIAEGGRVVGVITRALLAKEVAHRGLQQLVVVDTMHERKAAMSDMADGFVMLPGGFGTLDEFFEAVTWTQLGVHSKPCGILDVNGFFTPLLDLLDEAVRQRFIRIEHRQMLIIESTPDLLLGRFDSWRPTVAEKWLDRTDR